MPTNKHHISAVPTNIITGFLGVGKTSAILHLLKNKASSERWAVLVNEFGEIGVDGSMFEGQHKAEKGVFVREVPGGCMCCAAGLPMQIALNQLLQQASPDRLLIEPTGLGHPNEVLEVLSSEHYQGVLNLEKIITLVDARKLADERYTSHDTFNQQLAIADTIVANKTDLYTDEDRTRLEQYLKGAPSNTALVFTQNGALDTALLSGPTHAIASHSHHHSHAERRPLLSEQTLPECGYLKASNEGEGFISVGWRFAPEFWFSRKKLFSFLTGLDVERMKAVFITTDGVFAYNLTSDTLTEMELDDCIESRVEIIAHTTNDTWESQLLACLVDANV